jgi:hypothetical protein
VPKVQAKKRENFVVHLLFPCCFRSPVHSGENLKAFASPKSPNRIYVLCCTPPIASCQASDEAAALSERALDREVDDVDEDFFEVFFVDDEPGALLDEGRL